jgi:beta-barrel assembly-enhancing protease
MVSSGVVVVSPKLKFNGFLFNGKIAHKQPVRIVLTPFNIILAVKGKSAFSWPYSDIRWVGEKPPFHIERDVNFPVKNLEILVVDEPDFYENCRRIAPADFSRTALKNYFKWKIFSTAILFLLLIFYGALKFFPNYFVDQVVDKIPIEWEETLGNAVLSTFPVEKNPDPKVIALLTDILRILEQSRTEETPYNLKIYTLSTNKINALALPGGNIIIFEGLLKIADSPEELAGVLAHEAQHIFLKHSTQGILRNLASGLLMTLVLGDANTVMGIAINIAGQLNTLGFSRKMETEADIKGVEMMLDAKINPQGMFSIFKKLMKEELKIEGNKKNIPRSKYFYEIFSYISTHPSDKSRLNKIEALIANNSKKLLIPLYPNLNWNEIKPRD